MKKIENGLRYQIRKDEEICFSKYATSFYYKAIRQNEETGALFIVPTVTKKTGKVPTFRTEAMLCTWVSPRQVEIVS